MKTENDGFVIPVLKTHKGNWRFSPSLICCAFALVCFAQTVFGAGAGITTTITDADGDIATVQLSGSGTMTISLVNPSNGPIDHIALFNTDSSSSLTIKVKKSAAGDGMINVNAISGDGSLKTLSAKSANIVGSGINLGGFIGALTIKNLGSSTLTLQGNGVSPGGIVLGSFSGGVVSNSQIQIGGSVGKFSAAQMLNSQLWAGYTPGVSTNPMAGGTFANGCQIKSVSLKGAKGSVASAFVNSTIAAQSIGSVTLTSANTSNNGTPFGILADTGIKSVSVKQPKFKWNPKGHITQTLNDFQVRRLAEVIIASHTRVLTAADLSGLVISNSVYTFSASAPSLQGVQVGDVLVSSVGGGFLVDVLSVTSGGGSLVLQTSPGSLTDAIQKGAFDQTIPFVPTTLLYLAPGVTVTTNNVAAARLARASAGTVTPQASLGQFTFNYTFDDVELAPDVHLTGSADLTVTPSINVQIAFPFDLQSFSASVGADMTASVDVLVGASLSEEQKVLLVQYEGAPFFIPVGLVPIIVVPTLNLYAGVKAEADAGVDFSATVNGSYTAGAAWQKTGGWQDLGSSSLQFATTLAKPTMGGSVRGYLRPEITLALYGVSGPDIYGEGGVTLAGSVNSAKHQFCWSLTGDLDAGVGFDLLKIGSVDLSYQAQVLSYDHQFAGTCYSIASGSAPSVTTGAASAISSNSATLNGTVNPNGLATTAHFEWGTSTSYGNSTTAQSVGSGTSGTSVNFGLTGLNANTPYHFRLVANNSAGTVDGSDQTFTTTSGPSGGGSAPSVSTTAASAVSSNSATLNGTVNPNGLATTAHFEWGATTSYGNSTTAQSVGSGTSATSVNFGLTGLSPNTPYHFRLVANNSDGTIDGSDQTFTTTSGPSGGGSAPSVTTGAASAISSNSATLNGTVNPNGLATTAYFQWGANTSYGNSTTAQSVGSGTSGTSVNFGLTGLNANTPYHFRLVANNSAGTVDGSDQTFTTTSGPSGGGSAPTVTTMAASAVSSNSATLNGTVNPNGLATTVYFQWGTNTSYGNMTTSQSAGSGTSGVSVNAGLTGLAPDTTYHFQLVASNSAGGNSGGDQTFTTASSSGSAPTVVTLLASGVTSNAATLNGTVNPNGLATSAWFEWGTDTNYGNNTVSQDVGSGADSTEVNAALTGLTTNITYHFRLIATNSTGTSTGTDQNFTTRASFAAIAGGVFHSLALKSDGTAWAWGDNQYGQLGNGTTNDNSTVPVQVSGLNGVVAIAGGYDVSLAVKSDGTVWAWGANECGQLGNGMEDEDAHPIPAQVNGVSGVVAVAGPSLALQSDGTVWAWGCLADSDSPVQVSGLSAVVAIAFGGQSSSSSFALKLDGTVWAWGDNYYGELGNGTTNDNSTVPVQVSGLSGVISIACGGEGGAAPLALKSDGTVWVWGINEFGQLANGTEDEDAHPIPAQVNGVSGVVAIACGAGHSLAVKSDGTVWAWANNDAGQLGDGTTTNRYSPVQVTGLSGVVAIAGGGAYSLAVKSGGTVWAWGDNGYGQLGNGTTNDNSTVPVQVLYFP